MAYSKGFIAIPNVTGNIVIAVTTERKGPAYTNLIPHSADTDGSVYNGVGYKYSTRISSSGEVKAGNTAYEYITGFIPCKPSSVVRVALMNLSYVASVTGGTKIAFYDSSKKYISQLEMSSHFSPGTDGTVDRLNSTIPSNTAYIRICSWSKAGVSDYPAENAIVTIDEDIPIS